MSGSAAIASIPATVPAAAPTAARRVKRRTKAVAMVMSRAPISRSTWITCPFAASAAVAASVIIAVETAPIRISDSHPSVRSRLAAVTSGRRQAV